MSTIKITQLTQANRSDLTTGNANRNAGEVVVPIVDGTVTKKLTLDDLFSAVNDITASGDILAISGNFEFVSSSYILFDGEVIGSKNSKVSATTGSFKELTASNIDAVSGSFTYITSSVVDVDANTIRIGGESLSKTNLSDLKAGKSIAAGNTQFRNKVDATTFIRSNVSGKAWHYASNKPLIKLQTSSFEMGEKTIPVQLLGSSVAITGSTTISGSTVYTTTDLLTLLGNYGQTGSFAVSGSSEFTGDTDFNGIVNATDLMNLLAGFGASGSSNNTGSFDNSGSFSNEGTGSFTGSVDISGSMDISGSLVSSGSVKVLSGNLPIEFDAGSGGFNVNNLLDLLANFSSSGLPTGSNDPEGGVTVGDINLDGQVNVNDLLLGLGGYGNPNTIANNILIPPNVNHQYIGPTICILSPVSMSISTGSFVSITL